MEKLLLLIDEDRDEHLLFLETLKELNLPVQLLTAQTSTEALAIFDTIIPDYIILQLALKESNSIKTLIEIKKKEALKKCKVYVYLISDHEELIKQALQEGATGYLLKPKTIIEMQKMLTEVLS
jgi:CheY-like chemotaxis protein